MLKLDTRHHIFSVLFVYTWDASKVIFTWNKLKCTKLSTHLCRDEQFRSHTHINFFLLAIVFIRNTWRETARYFNFVYRNSTWFSIKFYKTVRGFFAFTYLRWFYAKLLLFLEFLSCFKITVSSKFVGSLKECKAFGVFSFNSLFKV